MCVIVHSVERKEVAKSEKSSKNQEKEPYSHVIFQSVYYP